VFLAKAYGSTGQPERVVLVKSLMSRNELHQAEFYHDVDLFSRVNHDHVVRLLGICREMEPLFLITEYCEWVSIVSERVLEDCS
jgi:PTK7 protein tyrosine kinase 7